MRISDWSSDVCSSDLHVARIASARIKIVAKRSSDALLHWSEKFADGRRANGALEPAAQKHTIYRLPFSRRLVRTHAANRVIVRIAVSQIHLQALANRYTTGRASCRERVSLSV